MKPSLLSLLNGLGVLDHPNRHWPVCAAMVIALWAPAARAHDDLARQWAPTAADAQATPTDLPAPQVLPGAKALPLR